MREKVDQVDVGQAEDDVRPGRQIPIPVGQPERASEEKGIKRGPQPAIVVVENPALPRQKVLGYSDIFPLIIGWLVRRLGPEREPQKKGQ